MPCIIKLDPEMSQDAVASACAPLNTRTDSQTLTYPRLICTINPLLGDKNLPRIHQVLGIQRPLHRPHPRDSSRPVLRLQKRLFP